MTEIKSAQPLPPASAPRQTVAASELALKLLQPMQGLLSAGESAEAEIVSFKEASQAFQLVLRLTLGNGRQATLEASSSKALAPGTTYAITALSDSRLLASPQPAARQPVSSLDLQQLPIGSVIQGRVVATSQQAGSDGQAVFKVVLSLLNSPLAGQKLNIESNNPLPLGSLLTAQVKGSQSLAFLPLSGRLDQLHLSEQLGAQQNRQASLEGVFKALLGAGGTLPEGLRGAAEKLLGLIPDMQQLGDAKNLAAALAKSGVFFEARLLAGQTESLHGDLKAALLRLLAQMPNLPGSTPLASAQAGGAIGQALPAFARNALGALGQGGPRQLAVGFPLPSKLPPGLEDEADLELLLKLAAAAVSRLQTHQLSSLAQTQVGPDGALLTTWQLELPMRDQHDIVPLQIKLQREDQPARQDREPPETLWKIELAFDVSPLGPLQVQAQLLRGTLSSQLWAERGATAELISSELPHLRDRLQAAGLDVGELSCRQGVPPQGPRTTLEQRFVDETA
ncbi:flagellar hook-length control protein FliK [Stutzerimonas stutzeri]|uniref:Flagellar hook-length control protein FliK n=1 Tax=Stutzerimonas stutzeri TaxID=316 RepID=A0A2N8T7F5_STUST|nr:flagellar hook-length control protein FliK [Stutzerimonas stutzeri]MCQ4325417.1 flagellar hook-length control protein FliK [Stutzerimonas stutzeri]PNG10683.1 flagellar hook-length control protein FliK [Stutzerimonas stutzeri]